LIQVGPGSLSLAGFGKQVRFLLPKTVARLFQLVHVLMMTVDHLVFRRDASLLSIDLGLDVPDKSLQIQKRAFLACEPVCACRQSRASIIPSLLRLLQVGGHGG
jgi:hypothetical protein